MAWKLQNWMNKMNIMQEWVSTLGLRHQGALVAAVRGSDTNPKEDPSKDLVRSYRAVILNAHSPNPTRFIDYVPKHEVRARMIKVLDSFDHYPMHFFLHLAYAAEIIGYKHPNKEVAEQWLWFYNTVVYKIHLTPETEEEMDERLDAPEHEFAKRDTRCYHH